MEQKISTVHLKPGMYVSKLDRPWIETSFPLEGVFIQDGETIETLRRTCEYVYIRTDRSAKGEHGGAKRDPFKVAQSDIIDKLLSQGAAFSSGSQSATATEPARRFARSSDSLGRHDDIHPAKPVAHAPAVKLEDAFPEAHNARSQVQHVLREVLDIAARGGPLPIVGCKEAVRNMVAGVLRNPDAAMWLRFRSADAEAGQSHHVDSSALAMALGRHLGFSIGELSELGLGALLIAVGDQQCPFDEVEQWATLSRDDQEYLKKRFETALDQLTNTPGVTQRVIETVAYCHECYDGSGYPYGLKGLGIPVHARMVALAKRFDALTRGMSGKPAVSPYTAHQQIYNQRSTRFQPELVEQFIKLIGIYPTGTLVELTTSEIGVVFSQHARWQLKPRVMCLLNPDKAPYKAPRIVDLAEQPDDTDAPLSIVRAVNPGQYPIPDQCGPVLSFLDNENRAVNA